MSDPLETGQPGARRMRFQRSTLKRLEPEKARRQGRITELAFHLLGRDGAIAFLNNENLDLGARPLDLAIASTEGCARVEAALGNLVFRQAGEI